MQVLIAGPRGTSKSHLAQALGTARCAGYDVIFGTQSGLLASLHAARAGGAFKAALRGARQSATAHHRRLRPEKPLRSPHDEDLHDLIAERYESAAAVVASNLKFAEWGEPFANKLLGAATLDRLRHGAYRVLLDGASYRAPRATLESPKKPARVGPRDARPDFQVSLAHSVTAQLSRASLARASAARRSSVALYGASHARPPWLYGAMAWLLRPPGRAYLVLLAIGASHLPWLAAMARAGKDAS